LLITRGYTPDFVIAALGAFAGGLEPLETFLKHMPCDAGIAFVLPHIEIIYRKHQDG
jgi:chemotaxis response regulator CheB